MLPETGLFWPLLYMHHGAFHVSSCLQKLNDVLCAARLVAEHREPTAMVKESLREVSEVHLIGHQSKPTGHALASRASTPERVQRLESSLKSANWTKKSQLRMMVPATWRSLTKIKLREYPDIKAPPTGDLVVPYEKFNVVDVIRRDGQHFLKLSDKIGWVFDRGIAGAWVNKPICERLEGANF